MKKIKTAVALCTAFVSTAAFVACATPNSTLLATPAAAAELSRAERVDLSFQSYLSSVENFAATFSPTAYSDLEEKGNFVSSPVSVYLALSLLAECTGTDTREEFLTTLGVTYEQLAAHSGSLYRLLNGTHKNGNKTVGLIKATNSVWIDDSITAKESALNALADNYYCYAYSANFKTENESANAAIRKFVKQQTNGLIDKNFNLSTETIFSLVNTLYLKDGWNQFGRDLEKTEEPYLFTQSDQSTVEQKLLQGYYENGRVQEGESYKTFFAATSHGYKLHFILPKDGYTADDVFTKEVLSELKNLDYGAYDEESNTYYFTRCLFPAFDAEYDKEINSILYSLGIELAFQPKSADFSPFTNEQSFVETVKHVAKLKVDEEGIEGAAVTLAGVAGTAVAPAIEIYEDFAVDKAFGFVLTNPYGTTLFSGVVNKI
ncbi:MAG: hypothetical protein IJY38_03580 [Clostridia bacterium]|nr:hypothetical protein [Clostridia bacterium]